MKIISEINQNIPYWSVIKGDHACTDYKKTLSENLVKNPNFLDPRENALRKTYLSETKGRKWLHNFLENKSFALVEIEREDLDNLFSVWKNYPIMDIAKEYPKAFAEQRGYTYKKITRGEEQVIDVARRRRELPVVSADISWIKNYDETLDYHRAIWMKQRAQDGKYLLIDGTHRTLATIWQYVLEKNEFPKTPWYAIMCVE